MAPKKKDSENIRVVVRCRNLLPAELSQGHKQAVRLDIASQQVIVSHPVGDPDVWTFDAVFNNTFTQRDIFVQEVQPLCDAVLQGYNATVFAYGQSGSGKTFTMTGDLQSSDPTKQGMMPQCVDYMFNEIKKQTSATKSFKVKVQYIELYNGKARDLLAHKKENLEVKQNMSKNFYVKGASVVEVTSYAECLAQFEAGTARRCTAETNLNEHSSRSHSLFTMQLESYDTEQDSSAPVIISSKINIVDLAGSEKLSKTGASGDTMVEGCNINLSLSALATVIDKIVKHEKHIPYRGSPLTMLLKDSLGGNSKTVMFANVGPSDQNTSETISTLRFAERAKQIENKPVKNLDPKDARIQDLLDKIAELEKRVGGGGLEEEDKLRERIEQLEVENDELRQAQNKDTLELEETNKKQLLQLKDLQERIAQREAAIQAAEHASKLLESNFKQELDQLKELKSVVTNFLKRVCSTEQLQLIRSKLPPDAVTEGDCWDTRDLELSLDGFIDIYEDWRRNVFTTEDLQREVQRGRKDATEQSQHRIDELERERTQLTKQHEEDIRSRDAANEKHSAAKVELANLKEENEKLREKIERDQEKMKKKLDKMREEAKRIVEESDSLKGEIASRDREVEKLKKMLEDGTRIGLAGSPGTAPEHDRLLSELEETRIAKQAAESKNREMILHLRRKGICVVANDSNVPPPPGAEAANLANDTQNEAFMLVTSPTGDLDGDLVSQMQQQLRVQHRLHQLRHAQQRKLEDLLRKYELLKTGKVTPVVSSRAEASNEQVRDALAAKEQQIAEIQAEHEKVVDKLVKKLNKKESEWLTMQKELTDEKTTLEEENRELSQHVDDLSKFNSQLALEIESTRSQAQNAKQDADVQIQRLTAELEHAKSDIDKLQATLSAAKQAAQETEDLRAEFTRLQQQNARTEASLKEKLASLDSSRQMIKWSNSMLEEEKKKLSEAEHHLAEAEKQYNEMEEKWRHQLSENTNKLVAVSNRRLEDQAAQYQALLTEEQEKQKALRDRVKKARQLAQKSAQKYDEMVLENDQLVMTVERLKTENQKLFHQQRNEDLTDHMSSQMRAFSGGRPQSAAYRGL